MQRNPLPAQETLLKAFTYNPLTGILRWKTHRCCNIRGTVAGTYSSNGYLRVSLKKKFFAVHRIVWKMVHGTEPEEIDHIDRVRDNNRIENLRAATKAMNTFNRPQKWWRSIPTGIEVTRQGRYMVRSCIDYDRKSLGTYDTIEEALAVRQKYVEERMKQVA